MGSKKESNYQLDVREHRKKSTKICQSIIDFSQPIHDPLPKLKSIITLESGCNLLLLFGCAYKTSVHWTEPLTCLVAAGNPELL